MNRLLTIAALLVPGVLHAQPHAPLEGASWLAGCWEGRSGSRTVEERWSPPRGGTMVGTGRAFRGDSVTSSIEFVVLRAESGTLLYEASPVGQARTVFRATTIADGALAFENRAHDFPQRIVYRLTAPGALHARVEGPMDGAWRGIDYHMARVSCDAATAPAAGPTPTGPAGPPPGG